MPSTAPRSISYTVRASLPDVAARDLYVAWLVDEHIADVIAHGAQSGHVVLLDSPLNQESATPPYLVEARYIFSSRESFETYIKEQAPKLRSIGLAKFGHIQGLTFERSVGVVLHPM